MVTVRLRREACAALSEVTNTVWAEREREVEKLALIAEVAHADEQAPLFGRHPLLGRHPY